MKMRKSHQKHYLLFCLTIILLATFILPFITVNTRAGTESPYLNVTTDEVVGFRGGTVRVTVSSSYSQATVQIYDPSLTLIYNQVWSGNEFRDLPIFPSAQYGTYLVRAYSNTESATTKFTVLNVSGWTPTSFPYSRTWKNVDYTFFGNGTIKASMGTDVLNIDLSLLRNLIVAYNMDVNANYNDMNFHIRASKASVVVDLTFSFIHAGCKFTINGTLDQAREFTFQMQNLEPLRNMADSIRSGGLIFDWGDMQKAGQAFSYEDNTLTVSVPQTFYLDPKIFASGFETGDTSEFDSEIENTGTGPQITTSTVYQGTYAANFTLPDTASKYCVVRDDIGDQTTVYVRSYVQLNALPDNNDEMFLWGLVDRTRNNHTICPIIRKDGSGNMNWGLKYRNNTDAYYEYTGTVTVNVDTWQEVEVKAVSAAGGGGSYQLWVNGSSQISVTGMTNDLVVTDEINMGAEFYVGSFAVTVTHDNIVVADERIGSYSAPSNDGCTFDNLSDTDNIYAQYTTYKLLVNVSDTSGYETIETVDATLQTGATAEVVTFRYTQATDTFSEQSGNTTKWWLDTTNSANYNSGNDLDLEFWFKAHWNATTQNDLDVKIVTTDLEDYSDTDTYDLNVDIVTDLVTDSIECTDGNDPDRVDVGASVTINFQINYTGSALYPPDAEFTSVSIYDSSNNNEGTDSTIVNGAGSVTFTAPATVGSDTYNLYINMADADYTDAEESTTETIITDAVMFHLEVNDGRDNVGDNITVNVNATYAFDKVAFDTGGSMTVNGTSLTYQSGNWWSATVTQSSVMQRSYYIDTFTDGDYGLTAVGTIDFRDSGEADYVKFGASNDLQMQTSDFTLSFWINYTSGTWGAVSMGLGAHNDVNGYVIQTGNPFLFKINNGTGSPVVVTSGSITANVWSHIVLVADRDGNGQFYVNGVSSGSATDISSKATMSGASGYEFYVGLYGATGEMYADINTVQVYNDTLTAIEIYELYQRRYSDTSNLVLSVNPSSIDVEDSTWTDLTGNGHDGTIIASTVQAGASTDQYARPIWDAVMTHLEIDDGRLNIDGTVTFNVNATYAYDKANFDSSALSVNGTALTYQSGNWWSGTATQASAVQRAYYVDAFTDADFGLTAFGKIDFDDSNDYVTVSDSASLDVTSLTLEAWVNPDTGGDTGYVLAKTDFSGSGGYSMYWGGADDELFVYYGGGSSASSDNAAVFTDTDWVHIAIVFEAGNVYYYRNGIQVDSDSGVTITTNNVDFAVGSRAGSTAESNLFDGKIRSCLVYNRALSEQELYENYQGYISNSTGLVLHLNPSSWDKTNGQWDDLSGEGNDGTVTSATVQLGANTDAYARPIWDGLTLTGLTSPSFSGSGVYTYDVQITSTYSGSGISSGVVQIDGLAATWTANSTGWATIVMSQTNATTGTKTLYGVSEPSYGLTYKTANQTFSIYTLSIQGRDAVSTNVPRALTHKILQGSTSVYDATSSSAGLSATVLPTGYTYTINSWWDDHLISSSDTQAIAGSDVTKNIDSKMRTLTSGSNYLLYSLNNTALTAPSLQNTHDWIMYSVSGSGSIELKVDNQNWIKTTEPSTFTVSGNTYRSGDAGWSWSSGIFDYTVSFSLQDLSMTWVDDGSGGGGSGGGGGGGTTPPPTSPLQPTEPTGETPTSLTPAPLPPQQNYFRQVLSFDPTLAFFGAIGIFCLIVVAVSWNSIKNLGSLPESYKRRNQRLEKKRKSNTGKPKK